MSRRLNSRRLNSPHMNSWRPHRELDPRVAWLLMMLCPRDWRNRYGAEVLRLTRELIAAGETTPARAAVNLARAAVTERWRTLGNARRPAMALAVAALLALAGSLYAAGHARGARPASVPPVAASLASVLCSFGRPAPVRAVPARAAAGAAGFPQTGPVFTFSLPAGTSLPAPAGPGSASYVGVAAGRTPRCVAMAALCDTGTGRTVTVMPGGLVVQVTISPGGCVLARSGQQAISGP